MEHRNDVSNNEQNELSVYLDERVNPADQFAQLCNTASAHGLKIGDVQKIAGLCIGEIVCSENPSIIKSTRQYLDNFALDLSKVELKGDKRKHTHHDKAANDDNYKKIA